MKLRTLCPPYRNLTCLAASLALSLPLAAQSSATQPATEKLDLDMYHRIADQGFNHSGVMGFASALADDIGPRLTGSPNMARAGKWAQDQLTAMGAANAHQEAWGESGLGWQQLNTWVRMVSPDTAVFIAQATPWSPSTTGPVTGDVVWVDAEQPEDLARYQGKLSGKIVLFGAMRPVPPIEAPLFTRFADGESRVMTAAQTREQAQKRADLLNKAAQFFADEHVAALILPSHEAQEANGGSGGVIFDDSSAYLGTQPFNPEHRLKVPAVVIAIENYGRMYRLLKAHVPVSVEMDVETKFTGDHELGYNTIAEIPGTDPALKDQVVMFGAHLDSWLSGTGAADNGAGVAMSLEAMRILLALHVKPRRTIRIALWSGEEQGMRGSRGYVISHFGADPLAATPARRKAVAGEALALKPEQKLISGYFNLDNGSGKIRGVYLQGNAGIEPIFAQWSAPLRSMGVTTFTLTSELRTDHASFDNVGIPGFQFVQDPLDYHTRRHHSNMDVFEGLVPEDLQQAAVVEAIFIYNAAMRDQMLPRKP